MSTRTIQVFGHRNELLESFNGLTHECLAHVIELWEQGLANHWDYV